ncbi:hypothetical protein [uncultured Flavonifractor sp.]|uniref:hypothetical protein n=1 Tax=uncultured Flavonifractor sp. TaxID=1193534 RepID=UPI002634A236|nr:hypothetical protein [uncultured Flavonifractor sp.]
MRARRLMGLVLSLLLLWGACPVCLAAGEYTNLGTLRVSCNGAQYTAQCWQDEEGHIYLPGTAAEQLLGREMEGVSIGGKKYVDMTAAADSCVYDQTLEALYIWDQLPAEPVLSAQAYPELGEPTDKPITYQEFFQMLDTAVELADAAKLAAWQEQLPEARNSRQVMTRVEGMCALLYAVVTLGGAYSEFNTDWGPLNSRIGEACWEEIDSIYTDHDPFALIPNPYPYDLGGFGDADYVYDGWDMVGVAYRYSFGRCSAVTGETLFDYDSERNSMRLADDFTRTEAVTALTRFLDSAPGMEEAYLVPWDDPRVTQYTGCLTPELLEATADMPDPAAGEELPLWNGAVVGGDYEQTGIDVTRFSLDARKLSEYGFNCARYLITYDLLFDRNVEQANLLNLRKLDALVAWAARWRIHLNLVTMTVPGRWTVTDNDSYTSVGEFDLFTNPERQAEAMRMWSLLARRYRDVSSSVLSFQPLWECSNGNLSTGLPFTPYTYEDVAAVYGELTRSIREEDPDRFLLYEPTAANEWAETIENAGPVQEVMEQFDNVQMLTNFCEMPYVYAEMTAVAGENIDDNNHSMFKPGYPVTYYAVQDTISPESPLVLQGDLPAGTKIGLYLSETGGTGTLTVQGDGQTLYSEELAEARYEKDQPLSRYYLYAKSDKRITVVLEEDMEQVAIRCGGDLWVQWCGMDVELPEEYGIERWWYPSAYDQFLEGGEGPLEKELRLTSNVMISPNSDLTGPITIDAGTVSYTTAHVWHQSNRETVERWGEEIARFAPGSATRIERAAFSLGTEYASALAYYGDVLEMCGQYGLGWFTNDYCFYELFQPYYEPGSAPHGYVGAEYAPCADGAVLVELLQLYQTHMSQPVPLPEAAEEADLTAERVGDAVICQLSYYRSGEARLVCAFYGDGGRVLDIQVQSAAQGETVLTFQGPADSVSARTFLLAEDLAPLCRAAGSP